MPAFENILMLAQQGPLLAQPGAEEAAAAGETVVHAATQHSLVNLAYLVASILFILGIKGMTHPRTAVRGNLTGAVGMLLAILATVWQLQLFSVGVAAVAMAIGAALVPGRKSRHDADAAVRRAVQWLRRPGVALGGWRRDACRISGRAERRGV